MAAAAALSMGQQTPGTKRLLKQMDCRSLVRSSRRDGQLLRSWHFPGPPSAVVQLGGLSLLALGSRSTTSRTLLEASARASDSTGVSVEDASVLLVVETSGTGVEITAAGDDGWDGESELAGLKK